MRSKRKTSKNGRVRRFVDANKRRNKYEQQTVPICGEHQVPKEWKATTFVYDDDGVSIEVSNVYAWVCPIDGEASFTSATTDELIETVRDLVTPAKRARERRSMPTEYIVRVA